MSPDLLEEILVETRPAPDPVWARELDERVERGFERPARRAWAPRLRPMLLPAMGMAASLALVLVIATGLPGGTDEAEVGGGSTGAGAIAPESSGGAAEMLDESDAGGRAAAPGVASDESVRSPSLVVPGEQRKIERSASLTLTAPPDRIAAIGDRVIAVTDSLGGYVASSSVNSSEEGGDGSFELKIPVRRLDRAMAELSKLAHVAARSQETQDITGSFNSARAQRREARAERESLLRQLADADTPNETASIRARLRIVAAELDAARRELRTVNRRAAYATVSVTLSADGSAPAPGQEDDGSWTPGDALRDAGRVLEVAAGVAIIALAAAVPLGLLALGTALAVRRLTRRRREAALDGAT